VYFLVVKVIKPQASRGKSSEMFALGLDLKPEYIEAQS
jgi:23S rRNA U2552 (ribose-2'-O)-methylase RlmE/FtsJ